MNVRTTNTNTSQFQVMNTWPPEVLAPQINHNLFFWSFSLLLSYSAISVNFADRLTHLNYLCMRSLLKIEFWKINFDNCIMLIISFWREIKFMCFSHIPYRENWCVNHTNLTALDHNQKEVMVFVIWLIIDPDDQMESYIAQPLT